MDSREIARRRMHNHRLWGPPYRSIDDVLSGLCAIQSQEFPYAKFSIAQRTTGVDDSSVQRAFDKGAILRTHALRPTWHFVSPADIRWVLGLTSPRVHAINGPYYKSFDLDSKLLGRTDEILGAAVENGRHLTRPELAAELDRHGIVASGPRLAYIVMHAELNAVICSGAMSGKQHTYALVDERATKRATLDGDEALAEMTRRYFGTRGPATRRDFMWWSSLMANDARAGIEMLGSELETFEADGRKYFATQMIELPNDRGTVADLVQAYDETVVSYTESKPVLRTDLKESEIVRDPRVFMHPALLDGRVIGSWKREIDGNGVRVDISPYKRLKMAERVAMDTAADRYAEFVGSPARVIIGKV